jgi:lipopolysaccharide/colanic/teichoic acid biosynthesis glycosyltransferase
VDCASSPSAADPSLPRRLQIVSGTSTARPTAHHHRRGTPRTIDKIIAGVLLVALAPLMAALVVLVRCTSRGPALFRQVRVGKDEQPFEMLKFRTMYTDCDDRLHREYVRRLLTEPPTSTREAGGLYKLVDDPRVTPVGAWLRRSSLDELPQLINVLRGEMALVGPRPALPWEAAMFAPRHKKRFEVRPGITGLWQTSGRNRLTMMQALDLDVVYVERRCLVLDVAILCRTIRVVLSRDGVR